MDSQTYKTTDLGEAAALLSVGARLLGLEPRSDSAFFFVFTDDDACRRVGHDYWSAELSVKAKTMMDNVRNLKSMVFARRTHEHENQRHASSRYRHR